MKKKVVIIGGVAAGASAAARLRRRDQQAEIKIFERGPYISYANCGLPYYVGDVIEDRSELLLQSPKLMKQRFDIDVHVLHEVMEIKTAEKKVVVKDLESGRVFEESYDKLLIATGSSPIKPPLPGIDGKQVFTLWTVPDTDVIKGYLEKEKPQSAVVIGGGFIGLEMAENLHRAGVKVSLVEMQNQVMAPMDYEMAQLLHQNMDANGVELILGDGVKQFCEEGGRTKVELTSGRALTTDMVILAIGVKPNSQLAREAGLTLNQRGGIVVNPYLETSDPDIYAAGDAVEVDNFVTRDKTMIPLAGPANKQGRIVADNIAGDRKSYKGSLGTAVAQVFDLTAATVGVNEKSLAAQGKVKGMDYHALLINQKSHAGYYPGATVLTLKLLFDLEGKILGAQVVGQEGADKRIDTIAVTMRMGGTVHDLAELELAYAPPYSSAKDPVNMLGFVAENVLDGLVSFTSTREVDEMRSSGRRDLTVLDVREKVEVQSYSIPGSVHIPLGQLRERHQELDKSHLIVIFCAVGVRAYNAARILAEYGFTRVSVAEGGMGFYRSQHYESLCAGEGCRDQDLYTGEGQLPKGVRAAALDTEGKTLDCSGLQCPEPFLKVSKALEEMKDGELLKVRAVDLGFVRDVESWCKRTGNTFQKTEKENGESIVYIQKGVKG